MKKLVILALFLLIGCQTDNATTKPAAEPAAAPQDPYLEMLRSDIRAQKVSLITEAMELTPEESGTFWPVYRQYEAQLSKIWDGRLALIQKYGERYETMNDETARELGEMFFDLEERQVRLNKQYFPKFEQAVGAVTAVKFFQVENRLDMLIDLQIASELPLIVKGS